MRPEIVHLIFGVWEGKEEGRNGWKEGGQGEDGRREEGILMYRSHPLAEQE